jgi:hypothetical protein
MRESKPDLKGEEVKNIFNNRLGWAGLDDYLPLKRGLWGEPLPETPKDRNAFIYHFFDVTKGQQITDDPKTLEIYRLWRKTDNTRAIPTPAPNRLTIGGKTYPLNPRQHEQYAIEVGTRRKEIVEELVLNPDFIGLPDENKIKILSSAYDAGADAGKALFWEKHGKELEAKPPKAGFKME